MTSLGEPRLTVRDENGAVTVSAGDTIILEGEARNGTWELGFRGASGIVADFRVQGERVEGGEVALRGAGSLRLNGVAIDGAAVRVSGDGLTISAPRWGGTDCRLLFRLEPDGLQWRGTMTVSETVPCALTPPATLEISVRIGPLKTGGRHSDCVVVVTLDEFEIQFVPEPPVDVLDASELPRIIAAARRKSERELSDRVAALEAEFERAPFGPDPDGFEPPRGDGRERALRHAGRVRRPDPPLALPDAAAHPASRFAATAYLAARDPGMRSTSYLPPASMHAGNPPGSMPVQPPRVFGRGAYTHTLPAAVRPAPGQLPQHVNLFPAPPRPGSSEHEIARQLLRCKDLLGGLRRL